MAMASQLRVLAMSPDALLQSKPYAAGWAPELQCVLRFTMKTGLASNRSHPFRCNVVRLSAE